MTIQHQVMISLVDKQIWISERFLKVNKVENLILSNILSIEFVKMFDAIWYGNS